MRVYALTPVAKADIFEIWSYIANDSEAQARPFSFRPYEPLAAFLDPHALSELHQCLSA